MTFTPSFFYLILLFITIFCTDVTNSFFVLVFYLLPLSLVPALYSMIESGVSQLCTWYFSHALVLGYKFPLLLCFLDYLFINQILSFLPLTLLT